MPPNFPGDAVRRIGNDVLRRVCVWIPAERDKLVSGKSDGREAVTRKECLPPGAVLRNGQDSACSLPANRSHPTLTEGNLFEVRGRAVVVNLPVQAVG